MHELQLVGHVVRLTYLQGLAIGLAALLVFGGVAGLIRYLDRRKGVNALISLAVLSVIVAFIVFRLRWPR